MLQLHYEVLNHSNTKLENLVNRNNGREINRNNGRELNRNNGRDLNRH